jgi:chemotaxis-related protein WspB
MLYLTFQLGTEAYALAGRWIVEVIPWVSLRPLACVPEFVAGVFDYKGTVVPVLDLCLLAAGRTAEARMSSRIVVVRYPLASGESRSLGLLAEQVTDLVHLREDQIESTGVSAPGAEFMGGVVRVEGRLVQVVSPTGILGDTVRDLLFSDREGEDAGA